MNMLGYEMTHEWKFFIKCFHSVILPVIVW